MTIAIGALIAAPVALAADPPPLDCGAGFGALRASATAEPGAAVSAIDAFEIVATEQPDAWKAHLAFTTAGHPAHPAVALRILRKQVTGVWTAESKGCGYGNNEAFLGLMADMKVRDRELTDASRADVERKRQGRSPLGSAP